MDCTPLHTTKHHCTPLQTTVHHYTPLYTTTHHCTPLHATKHHCTTLQTTVDHYTPLHTTAHHYTPLHTATHHSPGMNKKISSTRLILSLCPEQCVFTSPRFEGWNTKMLFSVLQVGRPVHKIHNSALLKVKEFTYQQHMQTHGECAVTKKCA